MLFYCSSTKYNPALSFISRADLPKDYAYLIFNSGFPPQFNEVGSAPYIAQRSSSHNMLKLGLKSELPIPLEFQAASLVSDASENWTEQ